MGIKFRSPLSYQATMPIHVRCGVSWRTFLTDAGLGFVACVAIFGAFAVVERNDERVKVAELERALVKAREAVPGIQIVNKDGHYKCVAPNGIRKEWELTVAKQCEALANIMHTGRAER